MIGKDNTMHINKVASIVNQLSKFHDAGVEQPATLAGQTARRLRHDIITLAFQPDERLTFAKLAKAYGVGTSPLREALFMVAGDGLVLAEENRGFRVAPIDVDEMLDISTLRAQLEAEALQRSIALGGDAWEAALVSADHRLNKATRRVRAARGEDAVVQAAEEWEQWHRALHTTLCSACGSPWLLRFIGILYEHLERYRRYFWSYVQRVDGADAEHGQIVEAALARDADRAIALLKAHFQTQAELSLQAGDSAQALRTREGSP